MPADSSVTDMTAPVGKTDPERDGSTSSIASSPEAEPVGTYTEQNPEHPQQQKRKGGRKPVSSPFPLFSSSPDRKHPVALAMGGVVAERCTSTGAGTANTGTARTQAAVVDMSSSRVALTKRRKIYATSEERKQRNRQAQAAFRERRTEYIKQLETTIKRHEEALQNIQNNHRIAADECLMLRYKNSLLERILLEKGVPYFVLDQLTANIRWLTQDSTGIDVQAELHAKTGSPTRGPVSANVSPNLPPLQQRAILNRQQQRRSIGGPLPGKADRPHGLPMIQPDGPLNRSPLSQPTPGSHLSSPAQSTARSPNFVPQGTSVSPNFGPIPPQQPHQQQQPQLRPQPPRSQFTPVMAPQRPSIITNQPPSNGSSSASTVMTQSSASAGPGSYYPSPFESHMNQLGKFTRFLLPLRHRALFVLD